MRGRSSRIFVWNESSLGESYAAKNAEQADIAFLRDIC